MQELAGRTWYELRGTVLAHGHQFDPVDAHTGI